MSRCRSCNIPLTGQVRFKDNEELVGKFIEEDFCTRCIYETEILEFVDIKTYQFEELTENIYNILQIEEDIQ